MNGATMTSLLALLVVGLSLSVPAGALPSGPSPVRNAAMLLDSPGFLDVTLTWEPPSYVGNGITGYRLYGSEGGEWTHIGDFSADTLSVVRVDAIPQPGMPYALVYRLVPLSGATEGAETVFVGSSTPYSGGDPSSTSDGNCPPITIIMPFGEVPIIDVDVTCGIYMATNPLPPGVKGPAQYYLFLAYQEAKNALGVI